MSTPTYPERNEDGSVQEWLIRADLELSALLDKLRTYEMLMAKPRPEHIDLQDWILLGMQLNAMRIYSQTLHMRISRHDQ